MQRRRRCLDAVRFLLLGPQAVVYYWPYSISETKTLEQQYCIRIDTLGKARGRKARMTSAALSTIQVLPITGQCALVLRSRFILDPFHTFSMMLRMPLHYAQSAATVHVEVPISGGKEETHWYTEPTIMHQVLLLDAHRDGLRSLERCILNRINHGAFVRFRFIPVETSTQQAQQD